MKYIVKIIILILKYWLFYIFNLIFHYLYLL
jgi:hypothetical protein